MKKFNLMETAILGSEKMLNQMTQEVVEKEVFNAVFADDNDRITAMATYIRDDFGNIQLIRPINYI